ncbi:hypothetical protein AB0P15_35400 [Streptomyces sp. NPDC087917]|uniref:hypothetical protein n=1 Tax=unclassified Streptomyces TaxID=2593676 RepID=UPI00342DE709
MGCGHLPGTHAAALRIIGARPGDRVVLTCEAEVAAAAAEADLAPITLRRIPSAPALPAAAALASFDGFTPCPSTWRTPFTGPAPAAA